MRRVIAATLILTGAACSGGSAPPAPHGNETGGGNQHETGGGTETGDTAAGECASYGLDEDASWMLPPLLGPGPWRRTNDLLCSGEDQYTWQVIDLNGDDYDDFVLTRDCSRSDGTGNTHWLVAWGEEGGWAQELVPFALPEPAWPYGWSKSRSDSCEDLSRTRFGLSDADGDGVVDLVVFDDCDESSSVGVTGWRVHLGGSDGFDPAGTIWELPSRSGETVWSGSERRECRSTTMPRYDSIDVDGDGHRDLLMTGSCGADPGLGSTFWEVIPGTGQGFDVSGTYLLSLPQLEGGTDLPMRSASDCVSPSDRVFRFTDIDGDGDRDLVITGRCDGAVEPGTTLWHMYENSGRALSTTVREVQMPDIGVERAWVRHGARRCGFRKPVAQSFWDVDGDGLDDLIVREMCEGDVPAGLGRDHFRLWRARPDGSYGSEERYELPADAEPDGWYGLSDDFCGRPTDELKSALDLNNDDVPDVVTTYGCSADGAVGWTEWRVALGGCRTPRR